MAEQYSKLIKDCIRLNAASQRQLYELFAPMMLGVCYRYTRNLDDAENILQDGFVKVFKNLHQFKGEGNLGGWIRRIMVNTALSYLKTNSRYQHDLLFDEMPMHAVSTYDPVVVLNAKELSDLIRQLPPGFQTIFNLHAVEGYSHVEIGSMLGIRDSTSRSQYARARALLIQWIEKTTQKEKEAHYGSK